MLFFRNAENAGNTVNTMVSEVFCICESIKNYAKIDVKTQVKLMMEKVRKSILKWIQHWTQKALKIEKIEVQDASKFLSFFSIAFLTRFFDFLGNLRDFGSQMGRSRFTCGAYFFSLFRIWAPAGVQGRPRERRRPILTSFLMDYQ